MVTEQRRLLGQSLRLTSGVVDYFPETRSGYRVTIEGDRPI